VPAYYPVFLDVRGRRCVVIGGNEMGEEKIEKLLGYDADILVISPHLNARLHNLVNDDKISWIQRGYKPGDLEGAFIAIVADTRDEAINNQVSREAKERNVPLNVMDVTHLCTFIAPAVVRKGDVIAAVSTGGSSPALARKFRELLSGSPLESQHLVMDYAELAPLLSDARMEIRRQGIRLPADHWQACITDDLLDLVLEGKTDEARDKLMSELMTGASCDCQDGVCKMWEEKKDAASKEAVGRT
jgi:precorrin-2 dehydrogenase/sirohydrochlorin ferrochelatase